MNQLELFRAGSVPEDFDYEGDWAVRAYVGLLPEFRAFGHSKQFVRRPDGQVTGNNLFLGKIRTGYFYVETGISALGDGLEVVKIVYDVPQNPFFMRWLTDEVRLIAPDKLLGRGVMAFPGLATPRQVFWFTVQRL